MIGIFGILILTLGNVHPRYNLAELPQNGGYAVKIGYNARLKFIVPMKCMDDAEVKNPTDTTQPGLEITTTHVQFGSTAVTIFIPPSSHPSPPGTMYHASLLCERVAKDGKTGSLFVLPLDVTLSAHDSDSTRTLAFFLDKKTALGFAESEIGIIRSIEDQCKDKMESQKTSGIGSVAESILQGFEQDKSYERFNTPEGDIGILTDAMIRMGDNVFITYRLVNLSRRGIEIAEIQAQSEDANSRVLTLNVLGEHIKQATIHNIADLDISQNLGIALRSSGTSGPGKTLRSVLGFYLPNQEVTTGRILITWKLSDGREIKGIVHDLRGDV